MSLKGIVPMAAFVVFIWLVAATGFGVSYFRPSPKHTSDSVGHSDSSHPPPNRRSVKRPVDRAAAARVRAVSLPKAVTKHLLPARARTSPNKTTPIPPPARTSPPPNKAVTNPLLPARARTSPYNKAIPIPASTHIPPPARTIPTPNKEITKQSPLPPPPRTSPAPPNAPSANTSLVAARVQRNKPEVYILTHLEEKKHIALRPSRVTRQVVSYFDGDSVKLTEEVMKIFNGSLTANGKVFIFCSSIYFEGDLRVSSDLRAKVFPTTNVNMSAVLNKAFEVFFAGNRNTALKNLVVIHETDDLDQVVWDVGEGAAQMVRNIHNVFFKAEGEKIAEKMFGNYQIFTNINIALNTPSTVRMENKHIMNYRFILHPPPPPFLTYLPSYLPPYLFKTFKIDAPVCANGRLVQTQGTCWWNSTMNVLLLTESTASRMIAKWNALPETEKRSLENIGLEACPGKAMKLKDFLFILINQILVKENRAKSWQEDFSSHAALLTTNAMSGTDFFYKKMLATPGLKEYLVNGNDPRPALTVIMGIIFSIGPEYNICNMSVKDVGLMHAQQKFKWTSPIDSLWTATPRPPMVILMPPLDSLKTLQESIEVNGHEYSLVSSALGFPGHVIAGLTCGIMNGVPDRYVYDSNNRLTRDNWPEGQVPGYVHQMREYKKMANAQHNRQAVRANRATYTPQVDRSMLESFHYAIYNRK